MANSKNLDTLKKVSDIAALAGIRGKVDDEREQFVSGFELPEGRSQMVYVRPSAQDVEDSVVITIFSPCHVFKKGLFKGCLLYTSPSPRDRTRSRMPSSA